MSEFERYFNAEFRELSPKQVDIKELLSDEMYLICGDFYGIQKFIFERLSSKNAAKVLRAKSAFIQIFTIVVAKFICKELGVDEKYILATFAGKFEILTPKFDKEKLDSVKNTINNYFIKHFFGLSGMSVVALKCSKDDFGSAEKYKDLRNRVSIENEFAKFKKLDLPEHECILEYDNGITNQTLCKICNIRKVKKEQCCELCDSFIKLGQKLADTKNLKINSKDIGIDFCDIDLVLDENIKSYVSRDSEGKIKEFETLSKLSKGENALAVLKADVDGMGKFIKNTDVTSKFANFNTFSKSIDAFFSKYIPSKMKESYPNSYVVFSGGDDLFIVGSYDEMIELAIFIREEFKKFTNDKLSISFGIVITKPSTPISFLSEVSENMLEHSKDIDEEKDAITIFGETTKWDSYIKTRDEILKIFNKYEKFLNTSFLYRKLLNFCDMSKNVNKDIANTLWKSKLNYSFRNLEKCDREFLNSLNDFIDKTPKETKMVLCEFIYKRRERDV